MKYRLKYGFLHIWSLFPPRWAYISDRTQNRLDAIALGATHGESRAKDPIRHGQGWRT